jgi:uncharacterized protein
MADTTDRSHFLRLAAIFEGGLIFVALGLGLIFRVDPFTDFHLDGTGVALGVAAALLPFLAVLASERFRFSALERIKRLVLDLLGPSLVACRWYELVFVAAVAGIGEELVFRGVLQRLFERWFDWRGWGWIAGLAASNVIFGLLHFLTPAYALLAGLMGVYFGLVMDSTHPPNLVTAMIAHGLYDYLAFLLLRRAARTEALPVRPSLPPSTEPAPTDTATTG